MTAGFVPSADRLPAASVVLGAAAVYAPSARLGFVYDDHLLIVAQAPPRGLSDYLAIFAEPHWYNLPYYRPVARLTMIVQKGLHGGYPGPYHLFNAAVIALIALAAFGLLRRAHLSRWGAAIGAALFTLHPVASSAAYPIASGRETLLPTLFSLLTALAFLHRRRALALIAYALALLSKEHAVVVWPLLLAADLLGLPDEGAAPPSRSTRLLSHAPFVALLIAYFGLRSWLFGEGTMRLALLDAPAGPLLSGLYAAVALFTPTAQLVYEPRLEEWLHPARVAVAVALTGVGLFAIRRAKLPRGWLAFWWLWIAFGLAPTGNILVQEARFAERYVFFSSLGVVALLVMAAERLGAGRRAAAVAAVALVGLAAISVHRGAAFADALTFARTWVRQCPSASQAHVALAQALAFASDERGADRQRLVAEALEHYERALELDPTQLSLHVPYAAALARAGREDEAAAQLERALASPAAADAAYNLGVIRSRQGRLEEARALLARALELEPRLAEARYALSSVLIGLARPEAAVELLSAGADETAVGQMHLGAALAATGDHDAAQARLERATALAPELAEAWMHLGLLHARAGRRDLAVQSLEAAMRAAPDWLDPPGALAMLLVDADPARAARLCLDVLSRGGPDPRAIETLRRAAASPDLPPELAQRARSALSGAASP